MITALAALALALPASAAPKSSCTREFDKEIELVLPAAIHARLAVLRGPHARAAAAFMVAHSTHGLTIGVDPSKAATQPNLPLLGANSIMQFRPDKGYALSHDLLHEQPGGERALAREPAKLAAFADALLPIWVHEVSHGRIHERAVRWPVAATIEDELIACYTQAAFTAETLAAEPGFAGLKAVYRTQRAVRRREPGAVERYRAISPTKRLIVQTLEVGAASTEEFERMYRSAYGMKASLADPLMAGLRHHNDRQELSALLASLNLPPSPQKESAQDLATYGLSDDAYWLDPQASPAAEKDALAQLAVLRAELDAGRPALRAWFEDAAGGKVDWDKLVPPRDVPIGVAPPNAGL